MASFSFKGRKPARPASGLLPEGDYWMEVVNSDDAEDSKAGNPKVEVEFKLVDNGKFDNRHVWDYITVSPLGDNNATDVLLGKLQALGVDASDISGRDPIAMQRALARRIMSGLQTGHKVNAHLIEVRYTNRQGNAATRINVVTYNFDKAGS